MQKLFLLLSLFLLSFNLFSQTEKCLNYTNNNGVDKVIIEGNNVWVLSSGGIVKKDLNGNLLATYTRADGLVDNEVYDVAIDLQGNKWFANKSGVSEFDGTVWTTYNYLNSGLPKTFIT